MARISESVDASLSLDLLCPVVWILACLFSRLGEHNLSNASKLLVGACSKVEPRWNHQHVTFETVLPSKAEGLFSLCFITWWNYSALLTQACARQQDFWWKLPKAKPASHQIPIQNDITRFLFAVLTVNSTLCLLASINRFWGYWNNPSLVK